MRSLRLLPLTLLLSGCIVEAPSGAESSAPGAVAPAAARRAPMQAIVRKLGANLGNQVEIASVTVTPGAMVPGEATRVSITFNVLEDLKADYTVFVHVEDVDGKLERMNLDHQPNNGKTPSSEWKKGQTVTDDFYLMLPPGVALRGFALWAGLWEPRSDTRLKLMNPEVVRNDGKDRLLLVQVPVAQ